METTFFGKVNRKIRSCGRRLRSYKKAAADYLRNPDMKYGWKRIRLHAPAENAQTDLSKRAGILDEFSSLARENGRELSTDNITDSFYGLEICDNTVLMVGLGKEIRGNLQYILNELNTAEEYRDFSMYVRTSDETDAVVNEHIRRNNWTRTHTVPNDKEYSRLLESVKYLITEVYFPESWVKKPGQIYVNIWHGTPLKKLGLSKNFRNHHAAGVTQRNFIDADYLMYPNEYTRDHMLASYKVSQLMTGKTFLLGYPRTGGMLAESVEDIGKTRAFLAPNGEKIYAFMPTFRDYLATEVCVAQSKELLDYLDAHLRPDQLLYVNLHHRITDSIDYSVYKRVRQFPPTIDSYRLLSASDALISDYSSVLIDYLALKKQIVLYIPDYEMYNKRRGMYIDISSLPFDKAQTGEEVLAALDRGKQYNEDAVCDEFCRYDSPQNAKMLCRLFLGEDAPLHPEDIPKNNLHRALIFSEEYQKGPETEFLRQFVKWFNREKYEVYLGCNMAKTNLNRKSAYPLLFESTVFGSSNESHESALGAMSRQLYLEGKISFEKAMECMKYDYALALRRMYGRSSFDSIVIYDTDNPNTILALAQSKVTKTMFLQRHMIDRILSGDHFLRDAVRYASRFCRAVFVLASADLDDAAQILGESFPGKIQVVVTPRQMGAVVFQTSKNAATH